MPNATSKVYISETDSIWSHCLQHQRIEYSGADTHDKLSDLPDSIFALLPLRLVHRLLSLTHQMDNLAQLYWLWVCLLTAAVACCVQRQYQDVCVSSCWVTYFIKVAFSCEDCYK